MTTQSKVTVGLVLAAIALLALRVWWVWPETLPGGPLLESIEQRSGNYSLNTKRDVGFSRLVDVSVFHGYSPERHSEFQEKLEDRPSKFVEGKGRHYYVEYVVSNGRMQFHNDYDEGDQYHEGNGPSEWIEFLPTHLPVDRFFDHSITVAFDMNREEFIVYIPHKLAGAYMTVCVKQRLVERIAWLSY